MKHSDIILLDAVLDLFDGDGGAAASAAGEGGAKAGGQGDSQAAPAPTRRGRSGEYQNVRFGKQDATAAAGGGPDGTWAQQPSDAGKGKEGNVITTSNTLEDKRRAFQALVNGEYKDIYTEETQRIIDRRFRETKNLEQLAARQQPVIDLLMQRYRIADGDLGKLAAAVENDDAYWSEAAEEAGMSVEQYKRFQKLQRENAALLREKRQQQSRQAVQQQLQKWYGEGEQVKAAYPEFDLGAECKTRSSCPCCAPAYRCVWPMRSCTWTRSRTGWRRTPRGRPKSRWWTASAPRAAGPRRPGRPGRAPLW